MTDIGRLKECETLIKLAMLGDSRAATDAVRRIGVAVSEIETLRAQLAAAERVVEAARCLSDQWPDENYDMAEKLAHALAAYDQGKVTICDSAPTENTDG